MKATTSLTLAPLTSLERTQGAERVAAAWLLGYGEATRRAYASDLRQWVAWLASYGVAPLDAQRAHVEAWRSTLETEGRAPSSIARGLSALASFYAYCVDEGVLSRSPLAAVRRPRSVSDSQTLGLDSDELSALLEAATRPRDRALVCLLALNGLRVSEALSADVGDLGTERGHRTLSLQRKGGQGALVPLAPRTAEAIAHYLADREDGPLFMTASRRRLDRHAAAKTIRRLAKHAGIGKPISPHSLRHTFVTLALDAGVSLRDVQDAAGHADPRTTRRYDRARYSLDRHPTYQVAASIG